jgi:hypothetical protein
MFGFRTFRFFSGALVFTLIATGNGEMVIDGARSAVSLTEKAVTSVQQLSDEVASSDGAGAGSYTKASKVKKKSEGRADDNRAEQTADDEENYEFTRTEDGQPVRWCAPTIRILLNEQNASMGALTDFRKALALVSAASGINLQVVGSTDLVANRTSHLREGDPYPAVLVAWALPEESDLLIPEASGVAVANPARTDSGMRLVTGAVVFNRDHDVLYRPGFGKGMTRGNLYLHELGHLLGLGHVNGDGELMAERIGSDTHAGLSAGDRAGLRAAGDCQG